MILIFDNFPSLLSIFIVMENCQNSFFLLQVACGSGAMLVIFSDFGLGQPKRHFFTHFVNFGHEGAPNVTKLTYNMIILWENSHRKKNWGSFVHRGLRYDFLRKKIWTVPLILQFNVHGKSEKVGL